VEFAQGVISTLDESGNTFLPSPEIKEISSSALNEHIRLSQRLRNSLLTRYGYLIWDDIYNITVQELLAVKRMDHDQLIELLEYTHMLSKLGNSSFGRKKYQDLLDPTISSSLLIAEQSEVITQNDLNQCPVSQWTSLEQRIFCGKFIAGVESRRLSKDLGIAAERIDKMYTSLLVQFNSMTFLGRIIDVRKRQKYQIVSRWWILKHIPELDIRLFSELDNYRILDLLIIVDQVAEYGDYVLDWTRKEKGKQINSQLSSNLLSVDSDYSIDPILKDIQPAILATYLECLGFKSNHLYFAHQTISQKELLLNYFELKGVPVSKSTVRSELSQLLDSRSLNEHIIDTKGIIVPISKEDYALTKWGFEPFLGIGEIVKNYILEHGPIHLEMVEAILDGYGVSRKKIKETISSPPFSLQDQVCYLMEDE